MAKASLGPVDRLRGARLAVILGSGLGDVTKGLPIKGRARFDEVPGVTGPDIAGHDGDVTLCDVGMGTCLFIRGRKHLYEGKADELAALIRFVARSGIDSLLITSAAGSLVRSITPGEIVRVGQILNFHLRWPLRGRALGVDRDGDRGATGPPRDESGRGADRRLTLHGGLNDRLARAAKSCALSLATATLASVPGPAYETRAEVRALQDSGATVVSMSAVPEFALADAFGIQVACLAVITNWATGISGEPLSHGEVLEAGARVTSALRRLITQFVVE